MTAAISAAGGIAGTSRGPISPGRAPPHGPLLPPPAFDPSALGNVEDALMGFYGERAKQTVSTMRLAGAEARVHRAESTAQNQRGQREIEKRVKAEREAKTFWGKLKKLASSIAKIATVVVSAVATVMTAGAAGASAVAISALVLSTSGTAIKEFKLLGKASEKIGSALELAGAVASVGGMVGNVAKAGVHAAGTAAGAAAEGATAMSTTMSTLQKVKTTAEVVALSAKGAGIAFHFKEADCVRDAELAAKDEADARGIAEMRDRQVREVIETMKAAQEAELEALDGTRKAIEACHQATEVAIAGVKG